MENWFTTHPFQNIRGATQSIKVGRLTMGANSPVRVQSMVNTPTHNVEASVGQAVEIVDAGGELVRFTVINMKDAEALEKIKSALVNKGYHVPVVADVHFNPALADVAAQYVDKVRINPGNYFDKRATFTQINFTDAEYASELDKLEARFKGFLDICSRHSTAIRIGTNHGSLSDRIMSRFGDTPEGMVEATMEFLRICKKHRFDNVLVSLKSSNTRVMVFAYRLLARQMLLENMVFGLHLGVTEAGSGNDGRIKSAVGIGCLMHDGLGDTIRVSLTEHPAKEIPVAKSLVSHFEQLKNHGFVRHEKPAFNPFEYSRPKVRANFEKPWVIADLSAEKELLPAVFDELGFKTDKVSNKLIPTDLSPDAIYVGGHTLQHGFTNKTAIIVDAGCWEQRQGTYPLFSLHEYLVSQNKSPVQNFVQLAQNQIGASMFEKLKTDPTLVLVCFSYNQNYTQSNRSLINTLRLAGVTSPIIVQQAYNEVNGGIFQIKSAADTGLFFIDGLADGLWLKNTFKKNNRQITETAFAILQASRSRITKTDYISCPGCGRTLFDLEKTLAEIKQSTHTLKGLKIAVMGCIVNGPGEMADADYGYVGAGPGMVSLYKGKEVVMRNIDAKNAVAELLRVIESDGA